ncbi:MAG: bacillithiol biosynthesis cysteine-adding enzyme BshC [Cytophagaceae bacterium]|jgi:bacillithiol biosynthesis cysteine-adding enzyme BshC|nr:bacillithiol biosynthesis cysteine-adding enzyme BshC [Cytophagaceae bacterium]
MTFSYFRLSDTHQFSSLLLDYVQQKDSLKNVYAHALHSQDWVHARPDFPEQSRSAVVQSFTKQYEQSGLLSESVQRSLALLSQSNTYTITTGHQLNLATGPLYFIYKIATIVKLCEQLKMHYPDKNFIPVYWMATEDHDIEEINHLTLFGTTYTYPSDWKGTSGQMPTEGMEEFLNAIPDLPDLVKKCYLEAPNWSVATRRLVHQLFASYPLLVMDANDPELKRALVPLIQEELKNSTTEKLVAQTNQTLESLGYSTQVHARDINLFYLDGHSRKRLTRKGDGVETADGSRRWTWEEISSEANLHPERFSPNVVLRPLYQEMILPNLCYCGGPAEVAYWLQLKAVFDYWKVPYPLVIPRAFVLLLSSSLQHKMDKLGLKEEELFLPWNDLKKHWIQQKSEHNFSIGHIVELIKPPFELLEEEVGKVDPTLKATVKAEEAKVLKQLQDLEKRVKKAEERKYEQQLKQLESIKEKLFPGGVAQERVENYFSFYSHHPTVLAELMEGIRPLEFSFVIARENQSAH